MHYSGDRPVENALAHRLLAQIRLAELMGVKDGDDAGMLEWQEEYAGRFGDMVAEDPGLVYKLNNRDLNPEELLAIKTRLIGDKLKDDKIDTGFEEHDDEYYIRAS